MELISQSSRLPRRSLREEDSIRSVHSILRNIIQRELLLVWIRELYPYRLHLCREDLWRKYENSFLAASNPYDIARAVQSYPSNVYVKCSHILSIIIVRDYVLCIHENGAGFKSIVSVVDVAYNNIVVR